MRELWIDPLHLEGASSFWLIERDRKEYQMRKPRTKERGLGPAQKFLNSMPVGFMVKLPDAITSAGLYNAANQAGAVVVGITMPCGDSMFVRLKVRPVRRCPRCGYKR